MRYIFQVPFTDEGTFTSAEVVFKRFKFSPEGLYVGRLGRSLDDCRIGV